MPLALPDEATVTDKEHAQWILHRLVPDRGICNIAMALRVERRMRWWPLQEALNHLWVRHPALRAVLVTDGPVPRKQFLPTDLTVPLTTEAATEENLDEVLTSLVEQPFDIDGKILGRAYLVLLPHASVVCVVLHHLIADYTSTIVLQRELAELYNGFADNAAPPPHLADPRPIYLESPPDQGTVEYWVDHLAGVEPSALAMAGARPIVGRPTFAGARMERQLSPAAHAAIRQLQQRTKLTQNVVLLAAFYLLLARHGSGPDVVVGIPVNGRRGTNADVVGFHANTLPVRVDIADGLSVEDLVRRTGRAFLDGMEHAAASFEAVAAAIGEHSGDWRVPLFRHMFNYRPAADNGTMRFGEDELAVAEVWHAVSRLDLEWIVWGSADDVGVAAVYSTEVHDEAFVRRLMERYDAIVIAMADALGGPIDTVSGWSADDIADWTRFNDTERDLGADTVAARVRAIAKTNPDQPAIRDRGRTMTYGQLAAAAAAVTEEIRGRDLPTGATIALLATRSADLAAATLGIWAAGCAYLPLDPAHPAVRLAEQIDDANAALVLTDDETDAAALAGRPSARLTDICDRPTAPGDGPLPAADDIAYIIYTSGSTGRPKGVEITHGNLANLVADFADRLDAGPGDRVTWLTTFSFDISALELFLPLIVGGTVVIAPDEDRLDADRLLALVADEDVTIVQATPTTWRHVAGDLRGRLSGRRVLSGGEPLDPTLADRLRADGCRLFNVYGPTETTIWSTAVELLESPDGAPSTEVTIGAPIANTRVHVLDRSGRAVPPGVAGELCIGGVGVARGYRDRPELTADRFRSSPVTGRYYRTGDLVRYVDGGLLFLGRLDRQVKIRGHRIEPAEIEAVVCRHPAISSTAVVTEADGTGGLRLVAAYQPVGEDPGGEDLRAWTAGLLPAGAVPSRWVPIRSLPLTGNGKIDHRAVAEQVRRARGPIALPADPTLRRLVVLWRDVLGDDRLDAQANFFLNGGHSLLAVELAGRIATEWAVPVGFDAIFDAPSPEQLRILAADERVGGGAMSAHDWWVPLGDGDGPWRMFAFPHAGAGCAQVAELASAVSGHAETFAANLPGRQARLDEAPVTELERLIDALADEMVPLVKPPYALFGYCGGALFAFLVARALRRRRVPPPDRFIVASFEAPDIAERPRDVAALPSARLWQWLVDSGGMPAGFAADERLRRVAEPAVRADFALIGDYRHEVEPPLSTPITVCFGAHDPTPRGAFLGWRRQSTAPVRLLPLAGGHWLLDDAPDQLAEALVDMFASRAAEDSGAAAVMAGGAA